MKIADVAKGVEAKSSSDLFEYGNSPSRDEEIAGLSKGNSQVSRDSGDTFVPMIKAADLRDRHYLSS